MTNLVAGAIHLGSEAPAGALRIKWGMELCELAIDQGCQLVVFPELAWSDYAFLSHNGVTEEELEIYASATAALRQLAKQAGVTMVIPALPSAADNGFYNGAEVIGVDGSTLAIAHKNGLPSGPGVDETTLFQRGLGWCCVSTLGTKVGVLICFDRRDPDHWRALRAAGAEVIAVMIAGRGDDREGMSLAELRVYSRLVGVHSVVASRAGTEVASGQEVSHEAISCVIGPDGSLLKGPLTSGASAVVVAKISLPFHDLP